jgi:hypothetical protein
VARWLERIALGTVMGAVAFVAERRLLKVIRRRDGEAKPERRRERSGRDDAELALPAQEVHHQPAREQAADDPQRRR